MGGKVDGMPRAEVAVPETGKCRVPKAWWDARDRVTLSHFAGFGWSEGHDAGIGSGDAHDDLGHLVGIESGKSTSELHDRLLLQVKRSGRGDKADDERAVQHVDRIEVDGGTLGRRD